MPASFPESVRLPSTLRPNPSDDKTAGCRAPAGAGLQLDAVAVGGNLGLDAALGQGGLEGLLGLGLAVYQVEAGSITEGTGPADHVGLAGMGREAADGAHLRLDRQLLAQHPHPLGAVYDLATQGAGGLEADDHQAGSGLLQGVAEGVDDEVGRAHVGPGDDDGPAVDAVDRSEERRVGTE